MSVSLSSWDRLRRDRPRVETAYVLWSENPSLVIATLLFGNTLASLGASVVANSWALASRGQLGSLAGDCAFFHVPFRRQHDSDFRRGPAQTVRASCV